MEKNNFGGIPQNPVFAFEKGEIVKYPLMVGSNKDDGVLFAWAISPHTPMPAYEYIAIVVGIWHDDYVGEILDMYRPVIDGDNREVFSELFTDYFFQCGSRENVRLAELSGNNNTYLYQFDFLPPCFWPHSQSYCCDKVCHGDELPFVFADNGPPFPWNLTKDAVSLANAMSNYWTSFAHYGDPNHFNPPVQWPIYRSKTDMNMHLAWPLQAVQHLKKKQCDFWQKVGFYHETKETVFKKLQKLIQTKKKKKKN